MPVGPKGLSSHYSTAQSCIATLQGRKGVAYALVGAAAWKTVEQKAQREALGLRETQPSAKDQSCCNLHISILRLSPSL